VKRVHEMPLGTRLQGNGVRFRLWAPSASAVELLVEGRSAQPMLALSDGWFELTDQEARPGSRYRFRVDGRLSVPDPASRHQPEDVHGPSEVVDPQAFEWTDGAWRGRPWEEVVLYELHVGAFTPEGSFSGVLRQLDYLAGLGVTAIELMPLAEFAGGRGWGYDGVLPFAPEGSYGRPDDLKRLVDAAHARGLMVILDVVYNHFGPDGNYLHAYGSPFFTERHHTPWGAAINFDGPGSAVVRSFFIENALFWLEEYHFDGLRFDAVHAIIDDSERHFLVEAADRIRAAFPGRHVHLVLENDANEARYLAPHLFDGQWNDDIHHILHVLLTGEVEGYYGDYREGTIEWLGRALTQGFAYQGEISAFRGGVRRGVPSRHLPATRFVSFLQNHDQVGNRALGERMTALAPADAVEAALAVILLAPSIPLLFMGEEWGAQQPFLYFCDFHDELAVAVRDGRRREFESFGLFDDPLRRAEVPDPNAAATFGASRLDWAAADLPDHRARLQLVRRLLELRRREIVPRLAGLPAEAGYATDGVQLVNAWWRLGDGSKLHLQANLGETPARVRERPPGRLLYTSHGGFAAAGGGGENLAPWAVSWALS
jgi:maltooligosyltrehalose trehalohydrolase